MPPGPHRVYKYSLKDWDDEIPALKVISDTTSRNLMSKLYVADLLCAHLITPSIPSILSGPSSDDSDEDGRHKEAPELLFKKHQSSIRISNCLSYFARNRLIKYEMKGGDYQIYGQEYGLENHLSDQLIVESLSSPTASKFYPEENWYNYNYDLPIKLWNVWRSSSVAFKILSAMNHSTPGSADTFGSGNIVRKARNLINHIYGHEIHDKYYKEEVGTNYSFITNIKKYHHLKSGDIIDMWAPNEKHITNYYKGYSKISYILAAASEMFLSNCPLPLTQIHAFIYTNFSSFSVEVTLHKKNLERMKMFSIEENDLAPPINTWRYLANSKHYQYHFNTDATWQAGKSDYDHQHESNYSIKTKVKTDKIIEQFKSHHGNSIFLSENKFNTKKDAT